MYLGDVLYVVVREAKQAVGNAQLMLAYDGKSTVAKQLVIVQRAARYGILDGSHTEIRTVVLYRGKYFFKGGQQISSMSSLSRSSGRPCRGTTL